MHHSAGCRPKTETTASPTRAKKKPKKGGPWGDRKKKKKLFQNLFAGRVCLWLIKRPKQTQTKKKNQRKN